jgi:hypothetical protein
MIGQYFYRYICVSPLENKGYMHAYAYIEKLKNPMYFHNEQMTIKGLVYLKFGFLYL